MNREIETMGWAVKEKQMVGVDWDMMKERVIVKTNRNKRVLIKQKY